MAARIFLVEDQNKWYLEKIKKAGDDLSELITIASVRYVRANLEFIPDIIVCIAESLTVDLALEMYRRGANNVVYFDENLEKFKSEMMKQLK